MNLEFQVLTESIDEKCFWPTVPSLLSLQDADDVVIADFTDEGSRRQTSKPFTLRNRCLEPLDVSVTVHEGVTRPWSDQDHHEIPGWYIEKLITVKVAALDKAHPNVSDQLIAWKSVSPIIAGPLG